ncbi:olfactory receptor 1f45-like [Ambystoma mexicanum]|uniref:olfactory receptor 1f45-like n=1 Tax=Ambystoma mexicanum TaxID=8296 RepID=UPI0037E811E8
MKSSQCDNLTAVTEFVLSGLSDLPEHQIGLFVLFLGIYLTTLVGNGIIISVTALDTKLHTPMYYFLRNFSFVDVCFTSTTVPKMLANLLSTRKMISYQGCITQLFFFLFIGNTESFLLAVMAYDRYVAICHPLHYSTTMTKTVCAVAVVASWVLSSMHSLLYSVMASYLPFYGSNIIHHFFCDVPPLLRLSCSDTSTYERVIFIEGSLVVMTTFLAILSSYIRIISTILKVPSVDGRWKTFSTCSSHLAVVVLFYGTDIFMYFRPSSMYSLDYDRVVSVMYTAVSPMLNPFIYSLRNKEVKGALRNVLTSKCFEFKI